MTPTEFKRYLQQWDDASKSVRAEMLKAFIQEHNGKTAPELEQALNNSASLFFTRLTAWLRLSYPFYILSICTCTHVLRGL